jgi:hypothetical protein
MPSLPIHAACSLHVSVTDINNPLDEISDIKSAANSAKVDVRFLFTAIMQESVGYVRARTTPNYTPNPSHMKSFDGTSCFGIERCPVDKLQSRRLFSGNTHIFYSKRTAVHKMCIGKMAMRA